VSGSDKEPIAIDPNPSDLQAHAGGDDVLVEP
jgi:hypothetical protein